MKLNPLGHHGGAWVLAAALVVGTGTGTAARTASADAALSDAVARWTAPLGRIDFNVRGDQRKLRERQAFQGSETGVILLSDFAAAIQADAAAPEKTWRLRPSARDSAMAQVILARILDHEATKRRFELEINESELAARVDFVVRSILVQFKRTHLRQPSRFLPNADIYPALQEAVGQNQVRLFTGWDNRDIGMVFDPSPIDPSKVRWPDQAGSPMPVELKFAAGKFPQTLEKFTAVVSSELRAVYRQQPRLRAWGALMKETPGPRAPFAGASNVQQQQRMYEALKLEVLGPSAGAGTGVGEFPPIDDPAIDRELSQRLAQRSYGLAFRKLAFELFRANRFRPVSRAAAPVLGPRALAEALFPEALYPGLSLKDLGATASSTLGHDDAYDRVQAISISGLERAFVIPISRL
jgi:hypothetical protein